MNTDKPADTTIKLRMGEVVVEGDVVHNYADGSCEGDAIGVVIELKGMERERSPEGVVRNNRFSYVWVSSSQRLFQL